MALTLPSRSMLTWTLSGPGTAFVWSEGWESNPHYLLGKSQPRSIDYLLSR